MQLDTVSTSLTLTRGQICIDLRSNLKVTSLGKCKHNSECLGKKKHNEVNIFPVATFVRKLVAESPNLQLNPLPLLTSGTLTVDLRSNLREILR